MLDDAELDICTGAIDGVRAKLPLMPDKWALPAAAAWCGGVLLFTFSQRWAIYREIKAQALAQAGAAGQQQTVDNHRAAHTGSPGGTAPGEPGYTYAESPNGDRVPIAVLDANGNPPTDWDAVLRQAQH